MLAIERSQVFNLENAARGARNPMNSWARMDSHTQPDGTFVLGENDLALLTKLCASGSDHRKFMRQIFVTADITAPIYWWKEYDTYKVGTTANSTSTMHKIHSKPFSLEDFSVERMPDATLACMQGVIAELERLRLAFLEGKDKQDWYGMIQLLPSSYNQMRTCTMTYENLVNMYHARKAHKLAEWHAFCDWVEGLPYADALIVGIRK